MSITTHQMRLPPLEKISHHRNTIDLVRQFHTTFDHPVAKELTVGDASLRRLRVKLIASELAELAQALGVSIELEVKPVRLTAATENASAMNGMLQKLWVAPADLCYSDNLVDLVETADALADLDYVVQGSNLVFGIPAGLIMHEVHSSNMTKLNNEGKPIRDADGKVVKGPNFVPPNIKLVLDNFAPELEL